jgi:hypothetical protein
MAGVITPEQCAQSIVEGIEKETFLILTHPEVHKFYCNRANDTERWVSGMRRYRTSLINEQGKFEFSRIFTNSL